MKGNVCSFIGHRPDKFNFQYDETHLDFILLKAKLIIEIEKIYLSGIKIFLTGCALGVDMWCGEIVLKLKEKYNDIELYCVLAFKNQTKNCSSDYKKRLEILLKNSNGVYYTQEKYSKTCYFIRNNFLVD